MANHVTHELLRFDIQINGHEGQAQINKLAEDNKKLARSMDEAKGKLKDLATAQRQNKAETDKVNAKITELSKNYNANSAEIDRQRKKLTELSATRNKNQAEIDETRKKLSQLKAEYNENLAKIDATARSMSHLDLTTAQLKRRIDELRFAMKHIDPNTKEYAALGAEVEKLDYRYRQLNSGMGKTAFWFKDMSDKINQYSAMITTAIVAFTAVAAAIYKAIEANNKLADAQTSVEKTTGLSTKQVKELTEAFEDFDTRTSKIDLLKIAEIGGRLGVAKGEIQDFTREVDKIYVALGDGFSGGVEQVAELLGKLKGLYKETRDLSFAEAMNQIGSAINELGAAGAASEENISEFAKRIGSLPDSLRPTIADALALGAAFEESGIDAERSATAYSSILKISARSAEKLTGVMKKSKEEIEKLINTDPTEFFLKFAESVKGMNAVDLAKFLDDMKLNDQFVSSILTAASGNMDRFRKTIALSNSELQKATSLQNEFNKVNNNAAAIYDKIKKKFENMYTSEKVAKTLAWLIEKFGQLIGAVEDADGYMTGFRNTIVFLTKIFLIGATAVYSYQAAMFLATKVFTAAKMEVLGFTIAQKAHNIVTTASAVIQNIWNGALGLSMMAIGRLTGNTTLQTAAQARLNAVTMANPYAALIALLAAAAAAMYFFMKSAKEAAEEERKRYEESHRYQTMMNEIYEQGKQAVKEYQDNIANLIAVLKDENAAQDLRKKAYEALIKIHPEFMGTVDKEYKATADLTRVYNELAKSIDLSARMKARANARQDIYNQIAKDELEYIKGASGREAEQNQRNQYYKENGSVVIKKNPVARWFQTNTGMFPGFDEHNKGIEIQNRIINNKNLLWTDDKENQRIIKDIQEKLKKAVGHDKKLLEQELYDRLGISSNSTNNNDGLGNNDDGNGGKGDKSTSTKAKSSKSATKPEKTQYQKDLEEMLKLAEKYGDKNLDLQAEIERRRIEMMEEGYEKEKALLEFETNEKIKSYEKQKITAEEFAKLQDLIAKTKPGKVKNQLEEELAVWKSHNQHLTDLQSQETKIRNNKLLVLNEKYLKQLQQQEKQAFDAEIARLTTKKNEALLKYKTKDERKEFLKDKLPKEEIDAIHTREQAKAAVEKYYEEEALKQQLEFLRKKAAEYYAFMIKNPLTGLTEEQFKELEKLEAELAEKGLKLDELWDKKKRLRKNDDSDGPDADRGLESLGRKAKTDIFGLSEDEWAGMFKHTDDLTENLGKVTAAIGVMQNMMSTYFAYVEANEKRQLQQYEAATERKKKSLKKQLEQGYINQETYKKLTLKADQDLDKKKWEMEVKAAKREKAMQIASIISSTAVAVVGALGNKPWTPLNFVLAGLVGAMGALQLGTVMAQPLPEAPGAEDGLYPVIREQDGKMFSARKRKSQSGVYSEPTLLVGEAGASMPELVVSGRDLKRIDPDITRMFMQDIARVRGAEQGLYPTTDNRQLTTKNQDEMMLKMMALLDENTKVMREIKDYGIQAFIAKSARNGKELHETIKSYQDLNNKNKH